MNKGLWESCALYSAAGQSSCMQRVVRRQIWGQEKPFSQCTVFGRCKIDTDFSEMKCLDESILLKQNGKLSLWCVLGVL